jgi:hypothetical protein
MMSTKMRSGWWSAIFASASKPFSARMTLAPGLHEENLGAATDRVAVVDHHHAHACQTLGVRHVPPRF